MNRTPESFKTKIERWGFNVFPAFIGTGGKISHISADYRHVEAKLPLNRRSKNYVGTLFGGSMFSIVDPVYMVMFYKILGTGYSVWVKSAQIDFLKPGKTTLYSVFHLSQEDTDKLVETINEYGKANWEATINLTDESGVVHAIVRQQISLKGK